MLHNILRGFSKAPKTNDIVSQFVLQLARLGSSFVGGLVESHANPGGGPTRENLALMRALGAKYVPPVVGLYG